MSLMCDSPLYTVNVFYYHLLIKKLKETHGFLSAEEKVTADHSVFIRTLISSSHAGLKEHYRKGSRKNARARRQGED